MTLSELTLAWCLLVTQAVPPRRLVAVGERWRRLLAAFAADLIMPSEYLNLVTVVQAPEEVVAALHRGWENSVKAPRAAG